uniref:Uncharacterized protein n=1 Tax=Rhipicephalus zambeziensis TaxID=60191 RepID=A0A224YFB6_9ACAR
MNTAHNKGNKQTKKYGSDTWLRHIPDVQNNFLRSDVPLNFSGWREINGYSCDDDDILRRASSITYTGRHAKQGRSTVKRISEQSARTEGPNSGRSTGAPRRERRLRRRTKATTADGRKSAPPADAPIKCERRAPVASR